MLEKLLKHDLKALGRILLPVNLITLAVGLAAMLAGFMGYASYQADAPTAASEMVFDLAGAFAAMTLIMCLTLVFCSAVITFAVVAWRFYRNLFTDEGYLTLTLPATAGQLAASKIVAGLIWAAVNIAVVMLCLLWANAGAEGFIDFDASDSLPAWMIGLSSSTALAPEGAPGIFSVFSWIGTTLLQALFLILMAYAALALGSTAAQRHKLAAGIGIFLALGMGYGMLTGTISLMTGFANMMVDAALALDVDVAAALIGIEGTILQIAAIAGFWAICVWVLKRKVNLA